MGFLRNAIHHVVRQSVRFSSSTSSNKPSASAAFSVLLGQKKVVVNPGDIPLMTAFTLDILAKNRDRDVLMINSAKEVAMNVKKGVLGVIDARTYEEFSKGHISGAFVLPHDTPDDRLERFMVLASKQGHEIFVIYCKERLQRSTTLAKRILELKPKHPLLMANLEVFLLEGALKNWVTKNELVNINMQAGFFS